MGTWSGPRNPILITILATKNGSTALLLSQNDLISTPGFGEVCMSVGCFLESLLKSYSFQEMAVMKK